MAEHEAALQPGSPVRVVSSSKYAGTRGTVTGLTEKMVYVSSPDLPGGKVRLKRESVEEEAEAQQLELGSPVRVVSGSKYAHLSELAPIPKRPRR